MKEAGKAPKPQPDEPKPEPPRPGDVGPGPDYDYPRTLQELLARLSVKNNNKDKQ